MFSVFLELVKRVGIFVIIGQTILHFGISNKFEKYMKLVISFMVAAQIIFAFGVYFRQEDDSWKIMSAEEYMEEWEVNLKEVEELMDSSKGEMEQSMEKGIQKLGIDMEDSSQQHVNSIRIEKIMIQ